MSDLDLEAEPIVSLLRSQVALIDPGSFRIIDEILQKEVKGPKKIETMAFSAIGDDERIE